MPEEAAQFYFSTFTRLCAGFMVSTLEPSINEKVAGPGASRCFRGAVDKA
jgi:hypothetical protein